MGSETTAAAAGAQGVVRRDPFAMLPFMGYHMSDYFQHWLDLGAKLQAGGATLPKIYCVNWFRKGEDGKFVWPGYGENMRVLKWIVERVEGLADAERTPWGYVPRHTDLDWKGLDIEAERFRAATHIDLDAWKSELQSQAEFFEQIGPHMPEALKLQRQLALPVGGVEAGETSAGCAWTATSRRGWAITWP